MKRGSIAILIILFVAVAAAAVSLWYHYANQQFVQEFWGEGAAKLIGRAPEVRAMRLGEPGRAISPDDEGDEPASDAPEAPEAGAEGADEKADEPKSIAFEFDDTPWMVTESKDVAKAKGIGNLRRALVLDSTFDGTEPAAEPRWTHALDMIDGDDFAAVLFDFKTRQIALAGARRTAVMNEAAAKEFEKFFAEQFEGEGEKKEPAAEPAAEAAPPAEAKAEAAPTSAEGKSE